MADPANEIATAWLFFWGCVGGFSGFLLSMALPWLNDVLQRPDFTFPRPWLFRGVLVLATIAVHAFLGGIAALIIGEGVKIGQPLAYGLAAPTVLKGAGEGVEAAGWTRSRRGRQTH